MEGGGESFPWAGEIHEVEFVVENKEDLEGLVLIHHRRGLMRTHLDEYRLCRVLEAVVWVVRCAIERIGR